MTTHKQMLMVDKYIRTQKQLKKIFYSSRYKEHIDAWVLHNGVTMAKYYLY